MRKIFFLLAFSFILNSCTNDKKIEKIENLQKPVKIKQFSIVLINNLNKSSSVSDVFETFKDISQDDKSRIIDEWTKKLNVEQFSSREFLSFNSYADASSKRESFLLANNSIIKKEDTEIKSENAGYGKTQTIQSLLDEMNTIVRSHCTMQGNKYIDFDIDTKRFYFGDITFLIDDVYASYEYKSDNDYSNYWLSLNCINGDCMPHQTYGKVNANLLAFDSKQAVNDFTASFIKLKTY